MEQEGSMRKPEGKRGQGTGGQWEGAQAVVEVAVAC